MPLKVCSIASQSIHSAYVQLDSIIAPTPTRMGGQWRSANRQWCIASAQSNLPVIALNLMRYCQLLRWNDDCHIQPCAVAHSHSLCSVTFAEQSLAFDPIRYLKSLYVQIGILAGLPRNCTKQVFGIRRLLCRIPLRIKEIHNYLHTTTRLPQVAIVVIFLTFPVLMGESAALQSEFRLPLHKIRWKGYFKSGSIKSTYFG